MRPKTQLVALTLNSIITTILIRHGMIHTFVLTFGRFFVVYF